MAARLTLAAADVLFHQTTAQAQNSPCTLKMIQTHLLPLNNESHPPSRFVLIRSAFIYTTMPMLVASGVG